MPERPVVTRFAPSPTGYVHIGNARTCLFSWLYARHMGGKFLLRIEDTDKARSTQEAIDAIFEGLGWLGIDWDDEPVYQSSRADRHREIAEQLNLTERTVGKYASNILDKLHLANRTQAALYALRKGIVDLDGE